MPRQVSTPRQDAFPPTMRTWLGRRLDEGEAGRSSAFQHVMKVYSEPLKIYLKGSSWRDLGDADELVQGFFADRLARETYLDRWRESGRPLRFWLIVGFKHYLLEEGRRLKRQHASELPDQIGQNESPPEAEYERQCALALVRSAMTRAAEQCAEAGLEQHWRVMVRHHLAGDSYEQIARDEGLETRRAAVMARTAANRLKSALRDLAGWEGAEPADIDREIHDLMGALKS